MKIIIYFFLFILSFKVNSISLTDQLSNFLIKENYFIKNDMRTLIRTAFHKNTYCEKPFFSLLNDLTYLSLVDFILTYSKQYHYLKTEFQVKGEYIVANRQIPRGTKIQESDLKILIGRLDLLPNHTYRKKKDVINRVNLRDIFPLQPITSFMTHPFWLVQVNQIVTVIVNGNDFTIFIKAKSLCNGAKNENIRVKTKTGKIITGLINKTGEVLVFL